MLSKVHNWVGSSGQALAIRLSLRKDSASPYRETGSDKGGDEPSLQGQNQRTGAQPHSQALCLQGN